MSIPVPLLSRRTIALAHCCALELWEGRSYKKPVDQAPSDEGLLVYFFPSTLNCQSNPGVSPLFQEWHIRELLRVAELKVVFRARGKIHWGDGVSSFSHVAMPHYVNHHQASQPILTPEAYGTNATLSWGERFVEIQNDMLTRNRVALANRILFFAFADMMIFNFSVRLRESLALPADSVKALPEYNLLMRTGLLLNMPRLSQLSPPSPVILKTNIYNQIMSSGWWARRVLDLALLIHFGHVFPYSGLHSCAKRTARGLK